MEDFCGFFELGHCFKLVGGHGINSAGCLFTWPKPVYCQLCKPAHEYKALVCFNRYFFHTIHPGDL